MQHSAHARGFLSVASTHASKSQLLFPAAIGLFWLGGAEMGEADPAARWQVDIHEVPDFNTMYELYDPCTIMFFFRNKVRSALRVLGRSPNAVSCGS